MDTWIGCAGVRSAHIGYICARGTYAEIVELKTLARSGIILGGISIIFIGKGVNNCCFWLYIKLIFSLIDGMSC